MKRHRSPEPPVSHLIYASREKNGKRRSSVATYNNSIEWLAEFDIYTVYNGRCRDLVMFPQLSEQLDDIKVHIGTLQCSFCRILHIFTFFLFSAHDSISEFTIKQLLTELWWSLLLKIWYQFKATTQTISFSL